MQSTSPELLGMLNRSRTLRAIDALFSRLVEQLENGRRDQKLTGWGEPIDLGYQRAGKRKQRCL
jgi:hypothetical protein